MAEILRSTLKKKKKLKPYSGQRRGAETAPSDICTQEEREGGYFNVEITHTHTQTHTSVRHCHKGHLK